MAIGDTDVELQFTNIVVNVPIVVGIQNTGVQTEIFVRYGIQRFPATLGVDYSLVFPVDLLTFQFTPTQSLMDKINAAGSTNVIYIQRVLPLTSDFDYDNAFVRQKLVDEFNRVWMTLQQQNFRIGIASPVTSWNSRVNDVFLYAADLTGVGGALLDSPHFSGIPTAPTGTPGDTTNQIATDRFVSDAIYQAVTTNAVTSFNGRQGNVNLTWSDVQAVGGAPTASPVFTGDPRAPTPTAGDNDTSIATTAFVMSALASGVAGVTSWNARTGVVTMTSADVTAAGGALAGSVPSPSSSTPLMDGAAIAGAASQWARGDHVHPSDTSRVAVSAASAVNPVMDGAAAPGAAASYSRGDHVHPSDTSRVAKAGDTMTGLLLLSADPVANLGAVTKQYVDLNAASIAVGDTPPPAPAQGKLWFDSVSGQLYVRYNDGTSAQWVIAVNNSPDLSQTVTKVVPRVFTTAGAQAYTPTPGMIYATIECVGGGGGGGGAANSAASQQAMSSGGGGGAYSRLTASAATIGASQTVTVGSGGNGGAAGATTGVSGGASSLGTLCVAGGGTGGVSGNGGNGGVVGAGDISMPGRDGGTAGSTGGSLAFTPLSGDGGASGGGFGAGAPGASGHSVGSPGARYGSGGSGGKSINAAGAAAGGAGASGIVIITEYCH